MQQPNELRSRETLTPYWDTIDPEYREAILLSVFQSHTHPRVADFGRGL